MKKKTVYWAISGAISLFTLLCVVGCEVDPGETGSRNVDINVWGVYRGTQWNGVLVPHTSGSAPISMNLRQYGDEIEGITDNSLVFRGTIGAVNGTAKTCSFTLEGKSTVGNRVFVNGHINISGSTAIMSGTWIEDAFYSEFYGEAIAPNQPSNNITVDPSSAILQSNGSVLLRVSGGSGNYTWSLSQTTWGTLSANAGSSVTYTAGTNSGVQTVTASDSSASDFSIITQN